MRISNFGDSKIDYFHHFLTISRISKKYVAWLKVADYTFVIGMDEGICDSQKY